jgi:hypothetical protein
MLSMIGIVLGVVLDYAFKVIFVKSDANYELYWRFVFAFTAVPCIIQIIAIVTGFLPESPMSLIQQGKMDEARDVLGMFNVEEVLNEVLAEMIRDAKEKDLQKIAREHGITPKKSKEENKRAMKLSRQRRQSLESAGELFKTTEAEAPAGGDGKSPKNPATGVQETDISMGTFNNPNPNPTSDKVEDVLPTIIDMYKKESNIQPEVQRILTEHHLNY